MEQKKELSRLTIDITKELHTRLKVRCVLANKSMRDLMNEMIEKDIEKFEKKMVLQQDKFMIHKNGNTSL